MPTNGSPCSHDIPAAINAELQQYQAVYADLNERHTQLDAILPYSPEDTGLIFEMVRLEKAMAGWRKKIGELMDILRGISSETSLPQEAK